MEHANLRAPSDDRSLSVRYCDNDPNKYIWGVGPCSRIEPRSAHTVIHQLPLGLIRLDGSEKRKHWERSSMGLSWHWSEGGFFTSQMSLRPLVGGIRIGEVQQLRDASWSPFGRHRNEGADSNGKPCLLNTSKRDRTNLRNRFGHRLALL